MRHVHQGLGRALFCLPLLFVACGDDDDGTGGGETTTSAATTAKAGQSASASTSSTTTTTASGSAGAGEAIPCAVDSLDLDGAAWDDRFVVSGVLGPDGDAPHVADFARDVDGSVLAAGRFRWLGNAPTTPIVRSAGASTWEEARATWEIPPPPFGGISAIAVGAGGQLAIATTGSSPEIWIDEGDGLVSIGALADVTTSFQYVRSLQWRGDALWAAGAFTLAGEGVSHLAVWGDGAWSAAPMGAANGPVWDLKLVGGTLYVGGSFDHVGGIAADRVASYDGTWHPFDVTEWGGPVYAVALLPEGDLVAGGWFGEGDACPPTGSVARWTGAGWEMIDGGVSMPDVACGGSYAGVVYDMTVHQGALHVAGRFTHVGGAVGDPAASPAESFARFVDGRWESLDGGAPLAVATPWIAIGTEELGITGQRLFSDGERLLAGILAPGVADVPSQGIIAYENGGWTTEAPSTGLGLDGTSVAVAVGGPSCAVHTLGQITHAGGVKVTSPVVRLDASGWSSVGDAVDAGLRCDRGLAVDPSGRVFVACGGAAGGSDVLVSDGGSWTSIASPAPAAAIHGLTVGPGGDVWAFGGVIGEVGEVPGGFVARFHDGAWTTFVDDVDGHVGHLSFAPEGGPRASPPLVIGGGFGHVAGVAVSHVARWDGAAWQPLGEGLTSTPSALAHGAGGVVFASDEGDSIPSGSRVVARWDGAAWTELATAARGFPDLALLAVTHLRVVGDRLVVGGGLDVGHFPPRERHLMVFDGDRFDWLGGGVSTSFLADVAIAPDGVWLAGAIGEAGLDDGRVSSVGIAHLVTP